MKVDNNLKNIYKKIYNNEKFIELIISIKDIKKINKYYKNNYEKYDNFEDFINNMGDLKELLLKSSAAYCEFKKQFETKKALQPGIITECFISKTIANLFSLEKFIDADEKKENIPTDLLWKIMIFKETLEKSIPRYIYHNEKSSIIFLQYGNSSSIDAIIINNNTSARIEFKEQKSKLSELDISGYTEDGTLIIDNKFKKNNFLYNEYVKIFNQNTTIFESIGHNFNISQYLNQKNLNYIIENFFKTKNIDLFILQQKNYIYPVLSKDLVNNIDIAGSEIRTAGRNNYKVFTPKYAREIIMSLNGNITEKQIVTLPFNKKNIIKGRGKSSGTKYKINNLLFVKLKDAECDSKFIQFDFYKIKQLKPTIAVHINTNINKEILKNRFLELNKK